MNMEDVYRVAIYLKGDLLAPEHVTRKLGIQPTDSHALGDKWFTSTGKEVRARTGFWAFEIKSESSNGKTIEVALAELARTFRGHHLSSIEGIEEAYVDIFIATDAESGGGGSVDLEVEGGVISALADIGVPLRLTISVVQPD